MVARPDPSSFQILPWSTSRGHQHSARMFCDISMPDGSPSWADPRHVLRRQLNKAGDLGFSCYVHPECEFFLLTRDGKALGDTADDYPKPCYDQMALMRQYDLIKAICDAMLQLGWKPYQNDHEDATGQYEMNWKYDDVLVTADKHSFFKFMMKSVAEKHGLRATFMPKPFKGLTGSGCHAHISVWSLDGKTNAFADKSKELGLSDQGRNFLGGIMKHASALAAICNPTVNSYHRLVPGFEAPVNLVYSSRNRSASIRIPITGSNPKAKRIEFRCPDPSSNPYLAFAACLLAGLDGIQNKIEPLAPVDKDLYELPPEEHAKVEQVPTSLGAVLDALEADHDYLLAGDVFTPDLISEWVQIKRGEIAAIQQRPHPLVGERGRRHERFGRPALQRAPGGDELADHVCDRRTRGEPLAQVVQDRLHLRQTTRLILPRPPPVAEQTQRAHPLHGSRLVRERGVQQLIDQ